MIKGLGVKKILTPPQHWYELAAQADNMEAKYLLGKLYYTGRGVDQDNAQAASLLMTAASAQNADAAGILESTIFLKAKAYL